MAVGPWLGVAPEWCRASTYTRLDLVVPYLVLQPEQLEEFRGLGCGPASVEISGGHGHGDVYAEGDWGEPVSPSILV